ncbi:MAG: sulfotransferase [Caulobacteraceae bacterium]
MARTGNTSLCAALRILGYEPVQQDPAFDTLRDLDGGSGNTVVLHFKYLDYIFPGSKFVLTTRPVGGWLRSMAMAQETSPRPIDGEHERIARRMAIYEHVGYDGPTLADSFQRHHAEVRRYFASRPQDLLELDATAGHGWERLCPFIGAAVPLQAYPKLNQSLSA